MAKSYEEKQFTQLSGEFGVVSELCRRQIQASLTYGNSKSADVFVIDGKLGRSIKVEVKTSVLKGWVVDARALNVERHIIWVFVYMPKPNDAASRAQIAEIGASTPSYHVLTSKEVRDIYTKKKEEKFKKGTKGPISFGFADVQFEQNKWIKVKNALLLNVRKAPGNNA